MKTFRKGPAVLVLVVLLVYGAFLAWYGGNGRKMSATEASLLLSRLQSRAGAGDTDVAQGRILPYLRTLIESDDGKEFYMLYLMQMREKEQSASGSLDADARNNSRILPVLLRHGNVPVFVGEPQGHFIHDAKADFDWHRVVLVRFRSRRDMLNMMGEIAGKPIGVLRWSAIEHQQVVPMQARLSLVFVRALVAFLLALLGLLLHLLLRLWPAYRGEAKPVVVDEDALPDPVAPRRARHAGH